MINLKKDGSHVWGQPSFFEFIGQKGVKRNEKFVGINFLPLYRYRDIIGMDVLYIEVADKEAA